MRPRPVVPTILLGILLTAPAQRCRAADATLDAAFEATFGQQAPASRSIDIQSLDDAKPPKPVVVKTATLTFRPERLVFLGHRTYALISYGTDPHGGHSEGGEVAVSYLEKPGGRWKLDRLWPTALYSGVGGEPANAGEEVHRFGGDPLFMARTAYCGMGECSEWIGVIRLSPHQPIAYDDVLAGAESPTEGDPTPDYTDCRNYDERARIGPPHHAGSLFSVRYDGWTAAPGTLFPKTPLHLRTDYVPDGAKLVMHPIVPIPTCGR